MTTLFFMRHAKTDMNQKGLWAGRTDCSITEEGKNIAIRDFKLKNLNFCACYVSPLKRTRETLEAVLPGKNPITDERIIERDFGDWEGKPYSIISDREIELYINGKIQPPGGETYEEVVRRVKSFVSDLFEKYPDGNILILSHATILRIVRDVFLPNMEKGKIKNSQVITVSREDYNNFQ